MFFKAQDVPCYDNEFAWFRWNVRLTRDQLTESINAALPGRYKAAPALIKTLQPNGVFRSRPIESIGVLTGLKVVSRGQGGNILEIIFYGSRDTISVETEYNIRALLAPRSATVRRKDGTTADNLTLLPSAFFTFDSSVDSDGSLAAITIYGGGFGHGAGMSQNGVKGMIDKGFNYIQILAHYYPGTDIKSIT
jgi:stage II sporulation protein D